MAGFSASGVADVHEHGENAPVVVGGGQQAELGEATHTNPIQTTNAIAFTIDTISQAFALAAFALTGAGMLSFATAAHQQRPARRPWSGYTVVVALVMLVTAASYAVGNDDFSDLMLFIAGVVALPPWLVWTGRAGRFQQEPQRVL